VSYTINGAEGATDPTFSNSGGEAPSVLIERNDMWALYRPGYHTGTVRDLHSMECYGAAMKMLLEPPRYGLPSVEAI
jgi:hypothetical protein